MYRNSIFFFCLLVVWGLPAWAQEYDEEQTRIERLEQENQELRSIIEEMRNRLSELEEKVDKDEKPEKEKEEELIEIEEIDEEIEKDEDFVKKIKDDVMKEIEEEAKKDEPRKKPPWLMSMADEYFKLGGRFQFEYYDIERETQLPSAIPENSGGSFHIDELRLEVEADFKNQIRYYGAFDVIDEDGSTSLKKSYVDFGGLPLETEIRAGLQNPIYRPSRYTEFVPLPGHAFWWARDLGLRVKGDYDPVELFFSFSNGMELDEQELGEDDSGWMIGLDEKGFDVDGGKEWTGGIEYSHDFDSFGDIRVLGFGVLGSLDHNDVDLLQTRVPGYGQSNKDTREMIGMNVEYDIEEWDFFGQVISGRDGEMDRFGWYAEASYKFEFDGLDYLDELRPLIRYGELDTNLSKRPYSPYGSLTWDRRQWLFAIITELTSHVEFRAEYALNEEETGGPDVHNNEWLLQLEVTF